MQGSEVLFREEYAAAQSLRNLWTGLASTYGCIMVVLTRDKLEIRPHWFARLLVGLLLLDLSHEISVRNILDVTDLGEWLNRGKVELRFLTKGGDDRTILLYLKRHAEFVAAVREAMSS